MTIWHDNEAGTDDQMLLEEFQRQDSYPRKTEFIWKEGSEMLELLARDDKWGAFVKYVRVVVMRCIEKNEFRVTITERPTE